MIQTRKPHQSPTPARTGGDDQPIGACYGLAAAMHPDPTPFDVLTDLTAGRAFEAAKRDALNLCGGCDLRPSCWSEQRDEPWMLVLRGKPVPRHPKGAAA